MLIEVVALVALHHLKSNQLKGKFQPISVFVGPCSSCGFTQRVYCFRIKRYVEGILGSQDADEHFFEHRVKVSNKYFVYELRFCTLNMIPWVELPEIPVEIVFLVKSQHKDSKSFL